MGFFSADGNPDSATNLLPSPEFSFVLAQKHFPVSVPSKLISNGVRIEQLHRVV